MVETEVRLRRLLTDQLGSCCDADVEARLAELHELETDADPGDLSALSALAGETRTASSACWPTAASAVSVSSRPSST